MNKLFPILAVLSMTACNFPVSEATETADTAVAIAVIDTTDTIAVDTVAVDSIK